MTPDQPHGTPDPTTDAATDADAGAATVADGTAAADAAPVPALYRCTVVHVRTAPLRHTLRHRTYFWLVDIDRLPVPPGPLRALAGFDPRDHFGGTAPTLRAGLDRFLAGEGVAPPTGRVLMLGQARVLGFVFNPLTLWWCHDADGTLRHVVAEVHSTYGERHCYLLGPEAAMGQARTGKELYVSPFFPVAGEYRLHLPEPGSGPNSGNGRSDGSGPSAPRLALTVALELDGGRPFTATVRGRGEPYSPGALLRANLRHPFSTLAVAAAIRMHGVWLWLRRLPVQPRPPHRPQKGMS